MFDNKVLTQKGYKRDKANKYYNIWSQIKLGIPHGRINGQQHTPLLKEDNPGGTTQKHHYIMGPIEEVLIK